MPTIDVVIVSYNTRIALQVCLDHLELCQTVVALRVIVVDNNSSDGSAAMVAAHRITATLICNDTNRGFAAAANQGIRLSHGTSILLLNSDTLMSPTAIAHLWQTLQSSSTTGLIAPRLLSEDGHAEHSCGPLPGSPINWLRGLPSGPGRHAYYPVPEGRIVRVGWASGACLMIRRAIFNDIGLLDEGYFMYFEDIDLCRRAAAAGWQIVCTGLVSVVHTGQASWQGQHGRQRLLRDTSQIRYYRATHQPLMAAVLRLRRWTRLRWTRYYDF